MIFILILRLFILVITAISKGQERLPLRLKKIFLRFLHVTFGNEEEHLQEKQLIQLLMVLLLKGLGKKETQVQLVEIVTIENPVAEKVVGIEIIETVTEDLGHQGKYILIKYVPARVLHESLKLVQILLVLFSSCFRRDRDRPMKGGSRDISPNGRGYRGSSNSRRSYSRTPSPSRVRSPRHPSRRERSPRGRTPPSREHRDKRFVY